MKDEPKVDARKAKWEMLNSEHYTLNSKPFALPMPGGKYKSL